MYGAKHFDHINSFYEQLRVLIFLCITELQTALFYTTLTIAVCFQSFSVCLLSQKLRIH